MDKHAFIPKATMQMQAGLLACSAFQHLPNSFLSVALCQKD